jgi:hypothetical protein
MVKRLSRPRPKQRSEVRALLYRRATAAEMLDTSISGLKRLEREGRLTPKRIGKRDVHYAASEIHALAQGGD